MSVVRSQPAKSSSPHKVSRWRLSAKKSNELWGIFLLFLSLLLFTSLVGYNPEDSSLLFHRASEGQGTRNLVGTIGAEIAALCLGVMGLPCFALPVLLAIAAYRRVRRGTGTKVVGRGFGSAVVLVSFPTILQLTVGPITWRGQELDSGGFVGLFLARALESRLNFTGSLLVLLGAMVLGSALIAQSTLGELLARWHQGLLQLWRSVSLRLARRQERKYKEKARERVVTKHLQRAQEKRQSEAGVKAALSAAGGEEAMEGAGAEEPTQPKDLAAVELRQPPRVEKKRGTKEFALRRVRPAPLEAVPPPALPAADTEASSPPQMPLPFAPQPVRDGRPPINLLHVSEHSEDQGTARASQREDELVRLGDLICQRCTEFGVQGTIEGINPGPVITVFEFQPAPGVKVSQIVNLQDDLALALRAESIRVDRLPGRSTLGIEVPNPQRSTILLGSLLADEGFRRSPSVLTMAIGKTLHGEPYYIDLASMPHLLVAGATGSGKSVGLQSMLTSIIYKATRDEVQFILIDPKRIELGVYADIPHLKTEVVVEPKKAANALRWAVAEMERRYRLLAEVHVRSIAFYNRAITDPQVRRRLALREEDESTVRTEDLTPLPYYVVVIDELADLMMVSSAEVESSIARLAQMARAVGIHLIVATQRPSVDVLTGTIKANFPSRIAYATATRHDSRTILDGVGAERLLGKGDMLFMPPGSSRPIRLHGAYISEQETAAVVRWLKKQGKPDLDPSVLQPRDEPKNKTPDADSEDELFEEAVQLVVEQGHASASFLQRRMRVGFSRAARLIDLMEQQGILGPQQGSKPREVLVKPDDTPEPPDHAAPP